MTTPIGASVYTQGFGSRPENVEIPLYSAVVPSPNLMIYPLGKRCVTPSGEYVLTSFSSAAGATTANWTKLGGAGAFSIVVAGTSAPLSAGSVTVNNSAITSSSILIYSANVLNNEGDWSSSVSNGSFTISSNSNSDTTNFFYAVINS